MPWTNESSGVCCGDSKSQQPDTQQGRQKASNYILFFARNIGCIPLQYQVNLHHRNQTESQPALDNCVCQLCRTFGQIKQTGCNGTKVTKSFEHIFVRRRSKARKSLYFSACDSLRRLEERESITQKIEIPQGQSLKKIIYKLHKNGSIAVWKLYKLQAIFNLFNTILLTRHSR